MPLFRRSSPTAYGLIRAHGSNREVFGTDSRSDGPTSFWPALIRSSPDDNYARLNRNVSKLNEAWRGGSRARLSRSISTAQSPSRSSRAWPLRSVGTINRRGSLTRRSGMPMLHSLCRCLERYDDRSLNSQTHRPCHPARGRTVDPSNLFSGNESGDAAQTTGKAGRCLESCGGGRGMLRPPV